MSEQHQTPKPAAGDPSTVAAPKRITIVNRGTRTYQTPHGDLKPGQSMALEEHHAKDLMGYSDIWDASKIVEATESPELKSLRSSNEKLVEENSKLKAKIAELEKPKTK